LRRIVLTAHQSEITTHPDQFSVRRFGSDYPAERKPDDVLIGFNVVQKQ